MTTTQQDPRPLTAAVFDTLELIAHACEGIGAGTFSENGTLKDLSVGEATPCCIRGMGWFADAGVEGGPVRLALSDAGIYTQENDAAVYRINRRKGAPGRARVSWEEYCQELNIQRAA